MTVKKIVVIIGLVLVAVGTGLYGLTTVDIKTVDGVIKLQNTHVYIDDGLFTRTYYMQYEVTPTENTKPDTVYRLVVDNGSVRQEDKIVWTPLELDIQKSQLIKHTISQEEYTAIELNPSYQKTVSEVRSERYSTYLMLPVVYIGILGIAVMSGVEIRQRKKKRSNYARPFRSRTLAPMLSDEEQALRCVQCSSVKMVNGILRCSREKCNR